MSDLIIPLIAAILTGVIIGVGVGSSVKQTDMWHDAAKHGAAHWDAQQEQFEWGAK